MKKFISEFKTFALRGNVMDMAVGVIIGGAFTAIVNSLVSDLLNPILGLITGGMMDFSDLKIPLGAGGAGIFLPLLMRTMTPEQRKEAERSERDERSISIRQRAAQSSWYWTLYLLWVPFVAAMVRGEIFWMVLCPAVIVLHCAFYLMHIL